LKLLPHFVFCFEWIEHLFFFERVTWDCFVLYG
jgi:hypothetical protein